MGGARRQARLALGAHPVIDHSKPLAGELKAAGFGEVDFVASLTQTDKHYAQIMSAMMQLDVSSQDVSTVRALLRPYLPGVEVHLGYLPDRQDDVERERAYWLARLLRVLRTPLQQPVANVRVRPGLDHPRG